MFLVSTTIYAESNMEKAAIELVGKFAGIGKVCESKKSEISPEQKQLRKYRNIYLYKNFSFEYMSENRLDNAAIANDGKGVAELLRSGSEQSKGLATWLVRYADKETLQIALENGLDPNLTTAGMQSALMDAALTGLIDEAKLLVEYGAKINYRISKGRSALSNAIACKHEKMAQFLVDAGSDVTEKNLIDARRKKIQLYNVKTGSESNFF